MRAGSGIRSILGWALTWAPTSSTTGASPSGCSSASTRPIASRASRAFPFSQVLVPMAEGLALLRRASWPRRSRLLRQGIERWNARGGHLNVPYMKSALAEALAPRATSTAALA